MPIIAMCFLSYTTIFKGASFLIASLVLIFPYFIQCFKKYKKNKFFVGFFFLVLFGSFINLFETQNGIGGTINFVVSITVAFFCIENSRFSRYFILILCLYTLYFLYNNIFVLSVEVNSIYENIGLSKNYPGFLMVVCCCYWGYFKYYHTGEPPLLLPVICSVFSFFLDGRSSLGILLMLTVFCFFVKYRHRFLIFIPIFIFAIFYFRDDILFYFSLSNLSESGMETSRYKIWSSYLNSLDLTSLVLGLDTLKVPLLKSFGGNPHNAFFNFHSRMGLLGLMGLCLIILKSISCLLTRKKYIQLVFVVLLLGRIFFDACLGSTTDYIIYAILFYPIISRNNSPKSEYYLIEKYI